MIELWDTPPLFNPSFGYDKPSFSPYILNDGNKHPALIICPGGAYTRRSIHEGEPIALYFNSVGISCFVLNYRVAPYKYPASFYDLIRCIKFVRSKSDEWGIYNNQIAVLGFSAGGHLVSTVAVHKENGYTKRDNIDNHSAIPDAVILCYPVIDFENYGHKESIKNLLGENPEPEMIKYLSTHNFVDKTTPQTFLWHTFEDSSVPVENSMLFAKALRENDVPFELHIFNKGKHGLALKDELGPNKIWAVLCKNWLKSIGFDIKS